ncbi:MAG: transglutaminase [Marinilabiliales bacterium]|nr:MAG: transglutaminase [Marinilabiliales bacterium]
MKSKFVLTFIVLLLTHSLISSNIPELIKKAGCSKDFPKADLLMIFDSTDVDVQESGLSYVNTHTLYKVLTTSGAKKLNVIKFGYDPLSAYIDIKGVNVYRKDGSIEKIDVSEVYDYPAPARMIYWGAREKMVEIGRVEPGDAVEVFMFKKGYTYALLYDDEDEQYIPPMRGHYYDIVPFWSSDPLLLKYYSVAVPKDKQIQYRFYNGEAESSMIPEGEKMRYTFIKKDIMPIPQESRMVDMSDIAPKLLISTSPDWEAKSLWFYGVNEDYGSFESTPEIDKKVDEILANAKDEIDSISLLTHWVADEIRYSGISMGPGEGYTLHSGDMNFTDRCGVCKDKAGMLITMLRAAGFESYPAMTMAGSRIDYIPADQFNHSVTVVKMKNGEYKLLDPTWVPFLRELWSSAEQQQNYLMGLPEGADLMETPVSPPENHFFRITGNSEISKDGTLSGEFLLTAEGQSDAAVRRMFTSNYISEWEKSVEKELLNISSQAKIIKMDFGEPYKYQESNIHIKVVYEIPDYAIVTEDEIIFIPLVAANLFKRGMSHMYFSNKPAERKFGFRDRCSRLVELNETVKLPATGKLIPFEFEEKVGDEIASFEGSINLDEDKYSFSEKIVLSKRVYEAEDWHSFSKVVESQKKFANTPVIIDLTK